MPLRVVVGPSETGHRSVLPLGPGASPPEDEDHEEPHEHRNDDHDAEPIEIMAGHTSCAPCVVGLISLAVAAVAQFTRLRRRA